MKIQGLIAKRSACLLAVSLIAGSIAAWCWLVFGSGVESNDFKVASVLQRIAIYSGVAFVTLLSLGLVSNGLRRCLRWLFCWRTIKRGLITSAGLLALVALFYTEENWRGRHAWEKFRREWEAKGERFDFASFVPPPVPDDQNFALTPVVASCYNHVLDRTGHRIQPENTNVVNRLDMDIYSREVPDNSNLALGSWQKSQFTDLKAWQDYYRTMSAARELFASRYGIKPPLPATNEFPVAAEPHSPAADVLLALSKSDSAIEELRRASRLPHSRFPLGYSANDPAAMVFPHYDSLKATASVLRLRAISELSNAQPQSALADVQLILYLADSIHGEPLVWSLRSQLQIVEYAIQPIWEGLTRRQWSEEQLAAMERELGRFDALRDYSVVLRSDLAWSLKTIDYLRAERANPFDDMCGDPAFWPTLAYRQSPSGWFYLNKVALARCYQAALPTSTELSQRVLSPSVTRRFEETAGLMRSRYWKPGNLLAAMFLPSLERETMTCARTQTSVDLARLACALERFRQANGSFPESLDVLAPMFIRNIPRDVVNGQPLHYRRTEGDNFLLYSIGWNEQDDGGEPDPARLSTLSRPAGDWVWHYPAK